MDSVQDFVNGFDVFQNCEITDGNYSQLSLGGKAVKIKTVTQGMEAKVYRVASELNQSGVQQRIDNMTEEYLTILYGDFMTLPPEEKRVPSHSDDLEVYRDGVIPKAPVKKRVQIISQAQDQAMTFYSKTLSV